MQVTQHTSAMLYLQISTVDHKMLHNTYFTRYHGPTILIV